MESGVLFYFLNLFLFRFVFGVGNLWRRGLVIMVEWKDFVLSDEFCVWFLGMRIGNLDLSCFMLL